jgi:hypothetical protein
LFVREKVGFDGDESHSNRLFGRAKVSFNLNESHSNRLLNWVFDVSENHKKRMFRGTLRGTETVCLGVPKWVLMSNK